MTRIDDYQLEGRSICNAGLESAGTEQSHWLRVISYWKHMREVCRRQGDCGFCALNRRWTNDAGDDVCIHTGQPCVRDSVLPVADLWSIVNGRIP